MARQSEVRYLVMLISRRGEHVTCRLVHRGRCLLIRQRQLPLLDIPRQGRRVLQRQGIGGDVVHAPIDQCQQVFFKFP